MLLGVGDASSADFNSGVGPHDDIHHLDLRQLIEDLARLIAETGALAELAKRFPEHIRQEADENVRLDPLLLLVPDRVRFTKVALVVPVLQLG